MRRNYKGISINTSKNTHEKVFELIRKDHKLTIIDIPSGSGAFVQRLKDAGFAKIIAIDIDNILEIEHDDFIRGDMTKPLSVADQTADIVVCIDGIEHINNQAGFVREVYRILKDQGEFVVSTPNISSIRSRWKWLMTGHHHKCDSPLDENNPNPLHHVGMISFSELRYLLHTNGLQISKVDTNRIKPVSLLFSILVPFIYVSTLWVYLRQGKKHNTLKMNKEVLKEMFRLNILFGETLIVKAIKKGSLQ